MDLRDFIADQIGEVRDGLKTTHRNIDRLEGGLLAFQRVLDHLNGADEEAEAEPEIDMAAPGLGTPIAMVTRKETA